MSYYNPSLFSLDEIDRNGNYYNYDTNPYQASDQGTRHAWKLLRNSMKRKSFNNNICGTLVAN